MSCWLSVFQFAVIHSHSHATSNGRVSASNVKDQRAYDNSTKVCIVSTITCTHTHTRNNTSPTYIVHRTMRHKPEEARERNGDFIRHKLTAIGKKRIIKWYLYCDCYKDCIMIFVDGKRRTLTNTEHLCAAVITIPKNEERKPKKETQQQHTAATKHYGRCCLLVFP